MLLAGLRIFQKFHWSMRKLAHQNLANTIWEVRFLSLTASLKDFKIFTGKTMYKIALEMAITQSLVKYYEKPLKITKVKEHTVICKEKPFWLLSDSNHIVDPLMVKLC